MRSSPLPFTTQQGLCRHSFFAPPRTSSEVSWRLASKQPHFEARMPGKNGEYLEAEVSPNSSFAAFAQREGCKGRKEKRISGWCVAERKRMMLELEKNR